MKDLIQKLEKNSIPEPNSGCWLWTGGASNSKLLYGNLRYGGQTLKAHRAAYMAYIGPIPAGLFVCHRCDVSLCINPDHLFLGTCLDNNADRRAKKRDAWFKDPEASAKLASARSHIANHARGERQGSAKLTDNLVGQIRVAAAAGQTQKKIAAAAGVTQHVISRIVARKGWKHVD